MWNQFTWYDSVGFWRPHSITSPSTMSITHIKKAIFSEDYSSLLADVAESSTLRHVLTIATSQEGSWPKFWDHALDKGAAGTSSALALLKLLTLIPYNGICPIKGCKATIEDDTAAAHFLSLHTGRVSQCRGYMFRRLLLPWSKPSYLF